MDVLPDTLQELSIEDLEAEIQAIAKKRAAIQSEIQQNNVLRKKYIEENSKPTSEQKNLKNSIEKSIKKQAKQKGYKVKN